MPISKNNPSEGRGYATRASHAVDKIHQVNDFGGNGYTFYPVVIIGAGESGIATAYKLKHRLGNDQFRIYDRQSGVGGTWWINRYPGVACDVPSAFYSFSFFPNPKWSTLYPPGPEIYHYLQDACNKFGITDKIELDTEVLGARWMEDEQEWEIELQHLVKGTGDLSERDRAARVKELGKFSVYTSKETVRCKMLVSAVGSLVEPKAIPKIQGHENFKGQIFHSARWNYDADMNNKNVIVIGTGCSAAQFVPHLTKAPFNAKSVTQLMRTPPWIEPKISAPGGDEAFSRVSPFVFTYVPFALRTLRYTICTLAETEFLLFGDSKFNQWRRVEREKALVARMKALTPEKYHEMLTPNYSVGCKRRIFDSEWYKSLQNPKIELTTMPLTGIQEHSVTLGPGSLHPKDTQTPARTIPADIIVLSNGFEAHHWLHPLKISGVGGKDLIDTMMERGGPQAYLGTAMDGFPNFLIIAGPNTITGHSSVVLATENGTDLAMTLIKPVLRGDIQTFDIKNEAEVAYTTDLQAKLKDTVFMKGGCSSWYHNDGWNSTVLPYSQIWFWYRTQFIRWRDWNIHYTKKGLIKLVIWRGFRIAAIIALIWAVKLRRNSDVPLSNLLKEYKTVAIAGTLFGFEKIKKVLQNML